MTAQTRKPATSLVALGGYTFMNLAKMTAEVEFGAFHTAPHTINALRCNLIGMVHLAPFLSNLNAHFVVILYCGDASLTGLAVDATAGNHLIHVSYLIIILHLAKHYTFPTFVPNFSVFRCLAPLIQQLQLFYQVQVFRRKEVINFMTDSFAVNFFPFRIACDANHGLTGFHFLDRKSGV